MFRFVMPFLVMIALTIGGIIFLSFVPLGNPPLPHALVFLGITLISLLVFYLNARFMLKRNPEGKRRLINGITAPAEVLAIHDSGMTINHDPVVKLTLMVKPEYGSRFPVTANTVVSHIAIPRPGDTVHVQYDPDNPQNLIMAESQPSAGKIH